VGELRWDGVLISAPEGQEVRAVHHGRVAFADWLRGFGLLLIIDHGDGYMTLYGHNQSLFKETGEWVEAGEPVALVGTSGGRARAGVYFGIRHQGRPVDPGAWCRASRGNRMG
jgi:septal ring factor EnvC (AmiA/AmiB activator)